MTKPAAVFLFNDPALRLIARRMELCQCARHVRVDKWLRAIREVS